ncbi:DNA protecting protein DprA [Candidatus Uhrbacteria bacterium RIFCSPHIGHO2_02_FULL_47_44]|uniref:DNA protecting protein DprA n=1 Tax=Candidatus Uhrbacteria bacterium RIFCSPLOWO2_02_FULL_48_18 TaxID=1802408 RepID=A0A1F7V9G2_9BACT|nr:MAG: DNA protecting protein DprA [Candidatus Uhrbacteria bacterium RIFCSPHIGHO2_02_FULL_47_44]OGL76984.1 MAG: DNA protecting protein DprA [Candidatus Uhrbacteria bacterium RIFCSPHIGHO2_12_FULL_47_12]OGL80754.1 MAG: DNA protecting protein DprA [Candidatus Uhrbacteria bacterium RIFCSPLOWO2_01_FULL_47_17]OGL86594.1 MAG: DNA protecting protein DprA [Candidatus Uhrbacteria bacterium RIFCSPLOWO2_02_FULL_48_18]OGL92909.1 MAG: DNA protecting protein DprA [Candidatus Uhrbacteria bacterium RIFCSPLOWO2
MSQPDLKYWLAIARIPNLGSAHMNKLFRAFPTMERAFSASVVDLLEAGFKPPIANAFLQERLHVNPDQELEKLLATDVHAVTRRDPAYPPLLSKIYDPPPVLYYRGTLPDPSRKHIAVVGTRHPSSYGLRVGEKIVGDLAEAGVVIVSGLAYGIDALAHEATLKCGGTTIAVLGSAVDAPSIYPAGNRHLVSQILAHGGAIVSEYPVGTLPLPFHFPLRNRIIAGLAHGTLVVEAAQKSGSLITARAALEGGRDVYAIPGDIDSEMSEGPNNLIKMGAIPVTCAGDMLGLDPSPQPSPSKGEGTTSTFTYEPRSETERVILDQLKRDPMHVDEIARATLIPIDSLGSALTLLEMKGIIKHEGGRYYTRQK